MTNKILVFTLFVSLVFENAHAQSHVSEVDSIFSSALRETRKIRVILPAGYDVANRDTYDVLYMLDGEWYTELLPNAYQFAKSAGFVPNAILVLIPNTYVNGINQRNRDFEPPMAKNETGYASFLSFLEKELFTFVDQKYPNNGQKSLMGSSLGGLFTVYTFLTAPDLFEAYLACDPNLDWQDEFLTKLAIKTLPGLRGKKNILFIATNGYSFKANGGYHFKEALEAKAPESLHWQVKTYQNETHYSLQYKAFYDALRYNYSGFSPERFDIVPQAGLIMPDKPLRLYTSNRNPAVRFTLNGQKPDERSSRLSQDEAIVISRPATLKIRNLAIREQYADSMNLVFGPASGSYAMKSEPAGDTASSLLIYEGIWNELPAEKTMGLKPSVNIGFINGKVNNATSKIYSITKKFKVEEDGYYIFAVDAPGGSRLYLADKLLIDNANKPKAGIQSYAIYLKKGYYTTEAQLFQAGDAKKPGLRMFNTTRSNDRWWENEL
jgi:predicted alpha/beta superfamily hydrolase